MPPEFPPATRARFSARSAIRAKFNSPCATVSDMRSPWYLPRVPEPEEMDSSDEVEVYNSAAAEAHLERIDNTFVEHVLRLLPSLQDWKLPALDIGCGPAQIPIKLLKRMPKVRMVVLDGAPNML